jgi:sec-independent protein translocase protein TatA
MDFLGVGPGELVVIVILALIFVGPRRLPEVARQIGKTLAELQQASAGLTRELNRELSLNAEEESPPGSRPADSAPPPKEAALPESKTAEVSGSVDGGAAEAPPPGD